VKTWLIGAFGVCFAALVVTGDLARSQNIPAPLVVSPASLDFGAPALGSEGEPQRITISNPGNATAALEDVLLPAALTLWRWPKPENSWGPRRIRPSLWAQAPDTRDFPEHRGRCQ
jgi:hypothetical protein